MGLTDLYLFNSFNAIPSLISTISPNLKIPFIKVPSATPHGNFLGSVPLLFVSNGLTTMNLWGETKSLFSIGIFHKWYITVSTLYSNCVEVGFIGDLAAFISWTNFLIYE